MLCTQSSDSVRTRINPMTPIIEWIINCLTRVWQILEQDDDHVISKASKTSCFPPFLKALRTCLRPLNITKFYALESAQATTLLCQSISYFLRPLFEDMSSDLEREVCWSMGYLLSQGQKLPGVLQVYNEHLGTSLQATNGPCSRMEKFGDDLQVCGVPSTVHFTDSNSVLWHWRDIFPATAGCSTRLRLSSNICLSLRITT